MSKLINGDSLEILKDYDENSIDLLCTDPPYGYGFMGKEWDKVLPDTEIFKECLRVLKPGSFAFVMSAPRSDVQYRMVQMLDEVGFEVGFTPIYWAYATGFPKAMNIGKAVDKRLGKERKVVDNVDVSKMNETYVSRKGPEKQQEVYDHGKWSGKILSNKPVSDKAKDLDGSYAGYQPKPAVEVVIVAMKPLNQKGYLDQVLDNGKGVTWLDDCRIPFAGMNDIPQGGYGDMKIGYGKPGETQPMSKDEEHYIKAKGDNKENYTDERGWDKWGLSEDYEKYKKDNVGSQKNFDIEPEGLSRGNQPSRKKSDTYERVSAFGDTEQSETKDGRNLWGKKATKKVKITKRQPRSDHNVFKQSGFKSENNDTAEASPLGRFAANLLVSDDVLNGGDEGSFSRYYDLDAWWENRLSKLPDGVRNTFPFLIIPKASKSEKNMGLENIEAKQRGMLHIGQLKKQQGEVWIDRKDGKGKVKFNRRYLPQKNNHPTVKPIQLFSYLVTLGSRKDDVVLDPFMGSGTTPISCVTLDRKYLGIEREKEYFEIAEDRVEKAWNPANLVKHDFF